MALWAIIDLAYTIHAWEGWMLDIGEIIQKMGGKILWHLT